MPTSADDDRRRAGLSTVHHDDTRDYALISPRPGDGHQSTFRRRRLIPSTGSSASVVRRHSTSRLWPHCCRSIFSGRRCTWLRPHRRHVQVSDHRWIVCPTHGSYYQPMTFGLLLAYLVAFPRRAPCSCASSFYCHSHYQHRRRRGRHWRSSCPTPSPGSFSSCASACRRSVAVPRSGVLRPTPAPSCLAHTTDRAELEDLRGRRVGDRRQQRRPAEPRLCVYFLMTSSSP